eukprot:TRINITY_DN3422_c0_g1_i2.p1 TRINITY_DN3422_c0_g1~~TRINITY_DN3422_c0_g1_i2.p1  ORF type:complete len:362 (+),score=85.14 TRINITY_DN3422_c0_g1_i2:80-1087(+)
MEASSIGEHEWMSIYVRGSPPMIQQMIQDGTLLVPKDFDWKTSLQERHKALQSIKSIKVESNGEMIKLVRFNEEGPDVFRLEEGEYVIEVQIRAAKVVDAIYFITNRQRRYGGGGPGGYYNSLKGQCLVGGDAPVELWHLKFLVKTFKPYWYQDPLYNFVFSPRLLKITVVSGKLVNLLSFEWNDGRKRHAGAEYEGLIPVVEVYNSDSDNEEGELCNDARFVLFFGMLRKGKRKWNVKSLPKQDIESKLRRYHKYEIILGPNEYVVGYEARVGKVMDAISFQTNKRYLGPYGGTGGKLQGYVYGENLQDITLEDCVWKDDLIVRKISNPVWAGK